MATGFDTRQLTVGQLFTDTFKFRFPPFQRPYRWTTEEAEALLFDLVAASRPIGESEIEPYFLGSIVVCGASDADLLVIDGRQRLTTLFLLFAAARDLESDPRRVAQLHGLVFDEDNSIQRVESGFRIRVGHTDADFFERYVASMGATKDEPPDDLPERHQTMRDIVSVFRLRLRELDGHEGRPRRADVLEFVLHRCELIVVKAAAERQALRLFQVLNSRGMELSETDLARPRLMAGLAEPAQQEIAEMWDRADEALGAKEVDRLLRALVFILRGVWLERHEPLTEELVDAARQHDIHQFHGDFDTYAEAMVRITREELPYSDPRRNPNHLIHGLRWIGRETGEREEWLPLALECVIRAGEDEDRLFDLIRGVDRMAYVAFINDTDRARRREVTHKAIQELRAELDPLRAEGAMQLAKASAQKLRSVLSQPIDRAPKRGALIRRVELELELRAGQELHSQIDSATAEHVLPQNYPAREPAWTSRFDRATHREVFNLLGNAVLLNRGMDTRAGSTPFAAKKRLYLRYKVPRPLETVRDACNATDWTKEVILDRTKRLSALLLDAWVGRES